MLNFCGDGGRAGTRREKGLQRACPPCSSSRAPQPSSSLRASTLQDSGYWVLAAAVACDLACHCFVKQQHEYNEQLFQQRLRQWCRTVFLGLTSKNSSGLFPRSISRRVCVCEIFNQFCRQHAYTKILQPTSMYYDMYCKIHLCIMYKYMYIHIYWGISTYIYIYTYTYIHPHR